MSSDVVENLTDNDSLLNILLNFEEYLDSLDLYVFDNWFDGIIINGPIVKKYFISVSVKYSYNKMPDPLGAERLLKSGSKVIYRKRFEKVPVEVKSSSDYQTGEGIKPNKPKFKKEPIWIIEIIIPIKFIDDFYDVEIDDKENIDNDEINNAKKENMDEYDGYKDNENE